MINLHLNITNNLRVIGDLLAGGVWSFSLASLIIEWDIAGITKIVQLIVAVLGVLYFLLIKIPHEYKMNMQTRRNKHLQNEVLKHEIEDYEEENKQVRDKLD